MSADTEIEAIRQLKYRYFRLLDQKKMDDLAKLMVPECTAAYHNGRHSYPDRNTLIEFLRGSIGQPYLLTMHHGHHPEIELVSPTQAKGVWYLHDVVLHTDEKWRLEGNGFYDDRYRKVGNEWKIEHTGYRRTFELIQPLGEVKLLYNGFEEGPF